MVGDIFCTAKDLGATYNVPCLAGEDGCNDLKVNSMNGITVLNYIKWHKKHVVIILYGYLNLT